MIDYALIRQTFVPNLTLLLGCPVISPQPNAPKPKKNDKTNYPYVGFVLTTPHAQGNGFVEVGGTVPGTHGFLYDYAYNHITQPTITFSFTVYSLSEDEATMIADQARNWFEFTGYQDLKDANLVVARTSALQNRDTILVDNFERRRGFDVVLRTTDQSQRTLETIENIEFGHKGDLWKLVPTTLYSTTLGVHTETIHRG